LGALLAAWALRSGPLSRHLKTHRRQGLSSSAPSSPQRPLRSCLRVILRFAAA
jgi:hypothetical protein